LLLERGIVVSDETIRCWAKKFGPDYAGRLRRKPPSPSDIWQLDEAVVTTSGSQHWLWRAVDQDGYVLDEIALLAGLRLTTHIGQTPQASSSFHSGIGSYRNGMETQWRVYGSSLRDEGIKATAGSAVCTVAFHSPLTPARKMPCDKPSPIRTDQCLPMHHDQGRTKFMVYRRPA
jgi:hypothetical protein